MNITRKKITLRPLYHRGQESIALDCENDGSLNAIIKKMRQVKWSQANKCWYVPLNAESYKLIRDTLKENVVLDNSALKAYLEKKKKVAATIPFASKKIISTSFTASPVWKLSVENLQALEKFTELLKLKAYSLSTIRTYRNEFLQLLQHLKNKPVYDLEPDDLKRYMVYAMEEQGINANTAHSRLNALYPVGFKK